MTQPVNDFPAGPIGPMGREYERQDRRPTTRPTTPPPLYAWVVEDDDQLRVGTLEDYGRDVQQAGYSGIYVTDRVAPLDWVTLPKVTPTVEFSGWDDDAWGRTHISVGNDTTSFRVDGAA